MSLIDLKLIKELANEAKLGQLLCTSYCYHSNRRTQEIEDSVFIHLMRTHIQAKALYTHLKKLSQLCQDFVNGEFQKHIDSHNEFDEDGDIYDPFNDLLYCFESGSIDDLPAQIEQYAELCELAARFTQTRQLKRDGFKKIFGNIPTYYLGVDEAGQSVMVPERLVPEDVVIETRAKREILEIETEYCLDGYNQFYERCRFLIASYSQGIENDVQGCAAEILNLYKA